MHVHIRDAKESDIDAINDIYNYYVLNSTCTAQTEPEPREGREQWLLDHTGKYAALVAEWEGHVIGWGSLSKYHRRYAYWPTTEDSIYVKHDMLHKGVGKLILEELIKKARENGFHSVIGCHILGTVDQHPIARAVRFHRGGTSARGRVEVQPQAGRHVHAVDVVT